MITLNHVTKSYIGGDKKPFFAINDIQLTLPDKGLVVLLGASGSGKTTLLNVMGGLDTPDQGTISYDGTIISKKDDRIWDRLRTEDVSYIFQNYELITHETVGMNVSLPLRMLGIEQEEDIKAKVAHALHALGMDHFENRKASDLSGGQQQRVAIARAIVKNPKVVFADEPTGNLDSVNTVEIIKVIKAISQERLVVLVTHETEIASYYGDRIITLKDGKVIGDVLNDVKTRFEVEDNDLIDLSKFDLIKDDGPIRIYSNSDDPLSSLNIRLIKKDDTLFVDVPQGVRKVRLVDGKKRIIEDASKANDPLTDTAFLFKNLSLEGLERTSASKVLSLKESIKDAMRRVLSLFGSGKVIVMGFLLAGMIVAFSASIVGNYFFNREVFVAELEQNVRLFKQTYGIPFETITEASSEGADLFINPYQNTTIPITIPSITGETATYNLEGMIDLVDHIDAHDLIAGHMPETDDEFVIDIKVFEETNGRYNLLTRYGIWNEQQLIGEKVDILNVTMTISGIVDTRAQRVYATRNGATLLARGSSVVARSYLSYDRFPELVVVTEGRMPIEGQREVLAPDTWFGTIIPYFAFFDETTHRYRTYVISGLYDVDHLDMGITPFIGYNTDIEYYMYLSAIGDVYINTDEPLSLMNALRDEGLDADWDYGSAVTAAVNTSRKLLPILFVSLFIVLLSGIGVLFMMRSSMLSRLHDMGVMRALGMPSRKLKQAFALEVTVLTVMTTLVGYLIGILLVLRTENVTVLTYMVYMNGITALLGALFLMVSNVLFGMISISRLTRIAPADLFRRYDM